MNYVLRLCTALTGCYLGLCVACWGYTCWYQQRIITDISAEQFLGGGKYLLKYLLG